MKSRLLLLSSGQSEITEAGEAGDSPGRRAPQRCSAVGAKAPCFAEQICPTQGTVKGIFHRILVLRNPTMSLQQERCSDGGGWPSWGWGVLGERQVRPTAVGYSVAIYIPSLRCLVPVSGDSAMPGAPESIFHLLESLLACPQPWAVSASGHLAFRARPS